MAKEYSVIIRNRNEADYIGFAIQSIIDHLPKDETEIIVIDNNSTDDSMEVVNLFSDRIDIRTYNIDKYSPGAALNLGVLNSTTLPQGVILIMSAHFQITDFDKDYLNELLNEKNFSAVFGKQTPIYRGKKITPRYIWEHFCDTPVVSMQSDIENRPFLHNAFCFYKKSALVKLPFPEDVPGKEDRYWAAEALKKRLEYLYTPEIQGNHFWTPNGATWKFLG